MTSTENVNKQIEVTQVRNLFKGWLSNYNKLKMLDVTKFEPKYVCSFIETKTASGMKIDLKIQFIFLKNFPMKELMISTLVILANTKEKHVVSGDPLVKDNLAV